MFLYVPLVIAGAQLMDNSLENLGNMNFNTISKGVMTSNAFSNRIKQMYLTNIINQCSFVFRSCNPDVADEEMCDFVCDDSLNDLV